MKINTDTIGLNIRSNIGRNQTLLKSAMERLSSGLRINQAADDSAGLAITERFKSQAIGTAQSIKNVRDGISLLQTADGASSTIQDIIIRMRELAIQSANETYSAKDRESMNNEFKALSQEIDRISNTTTFNDILLLNVNGTASIRDIQDEVMDALKEQIPHWIDDGLKANLDILGINSVPTGINIDVQFYNDPNTGTRASMGGVPGSNDYVLRVNLGRLLDSNGEIPGGTGTFPAAISGGDFDTVIAHEITHNLQFAKMPGLTFSAGEMWFIEGLASAIQGRNTYFNSKSYPKEDAFVSKSSWNGDYEASFAATKTLHEITDGGMQAIIDRLEMGDTLNEAFQNTTQKAQLEFAGASVPDFTNANDFIDWFNTSPDVDNYLSTSTDFTVGEGAIQGAAGSSNSASKDGTIPNNTTLETGPNNGGAYNITFSGLNGGAANTNGADGVIKLHVGYKFDDTIEIEKGNMSTDGLNISGLSIETVQGAQLAMSSLLTALDRVSEYRGKVGSYINRIEMIENNLNTMYNETESTRSKIEDADIASETSNLTKAEILSQTAMNVLKKNTEIQMNVLQLLNN